LASLTGSPQGGISTTGHPSPYIANLAKPSSHLIHGSLGPLESAPQTASWSVQPTFHSSLMCPTHR